MPNPTTTSTKFSNAEFFARFLTEPQRQFQLFISQERKLHKPAPINDPKFWKEWNLLSGYLDNTNNADVKIYKKKLDDMSLAVKFQEDLHKIRSDYRNALKNLAISKGTFISLALLLRDYKPVNGDISFSVVNETLLEAIKNTIINDSLFAGSEIKTPRKLSEQEYDTIENLVVLECDLIKVKELLELLVWEDFELKNENWYLYPLKKGVEVTEDMEIMPSEAWADEIIELRKELPIPVDTSIRLDTIRWLKLTLPDGMSKSKNNFLTCLAKEDVKKSFYRDKADKENNELKAIQPQVRIKLDEKLKSNPRFALQDPSAFFSYASMSILEEYGIEVLKNSIGNIYFPQENIDIEKLYIVFEDEDLLLKDIIYFIGLLEWYSSSKDTLKIKYELMTDAQMVDLVRKNVLFKDRLEKPDSYFFKIIHLISNVRTKLSFTPLIGITEDTYALAYSGFYEFQRSFYNRIITGKLFDNANNPEISDEIALNHSAREKDVCKSIIGWFDVFEPDIPRAANFKFPHDTDWWGSMGGEIDDLIFFPENNLLFIIQLKLCNSLAKSGNSMKKWIERNIQGEAKRQIVRDFEFIRHRVEGAKFTVEEGLKLKKGGNFRPEIFPLIVTDVFGYDHKLIRIDERPAEVTCVSLFELECLLKGLKGFEEQEERIMPLKNKGAWLRDQIMSNNFWKGMESRINNERIQFRIGTHIDKARWSCDI